MQYDMTKGRIAPLLIKFTIPVLIGNVFQQFYNMVDTVIVGRFVGENALAAVGSTGTIMFLILGFAMGLTNGFTVLTAQAFGAGDRERMRHSVANGILLSVIVTILMTFFSVLSLRPLLHLMNTPDEIFDDAYTYISIICYGCVAPIYYNLFTSYLRAIGNSKVPLYFLILSSCLNIFLDLFFIIQLKMGVAGAALATDLAQGISAALTLLYIYKKSPMLRPQNTDWHLDRSESAIQVKIGLPMALQFAITASGTMIMQSSINLFGATVISAYTAASKVQMLFTQEQSAMGVSITTYSGQNYGAGNIERINKGVRVAMLIGVIYSIIAAIAEIAFLPGMSRLFFSSDVDMTEMLKWEYPYIYISAIFFIPLAGIFVFRDTMQGCGYSVPPTLCGVVELCARFAMAQIAIAQHSYPIAVSADAAAWIAASLFGFFAYRYTLRDMKKRMSAGTMPHSSAAEN